MKDKNNKNNIVKVILIGIIVILIMVIAICIYFICADCLKEEKMEKDVSDTNNANITIMDITKENFETEVQNSDKPVLICFETYWCKDCQEAQPIIEEIAKEISSFAKICRVNIDEQQELKTKYEIEYIPTFILFENGQEIKRIVGKIPKEELLQIFNTK